MEEEKAEGEGLIAVFKYLMGGYRKEKNQQSQMLFRYSMEGLWAIGTSLGVQFTNYYCIEGKKKFRMKDA